MEMNPYAAPEADVIPANQATLTEETIRTQHLNTEAAIKSIGTLYYIGAFIGVPAGAVALISMRPGQHLVLMLGLFLLVVGLSQGVLAYGLRRLLPWARVPAVVLSCFGLFAFPIGTIISIRFISTLTCPKGRTVMTPDYHRIMKATPHIKRKTSAIAWAALVLVLIWVGWIITKAVYRF